MVASDERRPSEGLRVIPPSSPNHEFDQLAAIDYQFLEDSANCAYQTDESDFFIDDGRSHFSSPASRLRVEYPYSDGSRLNGSDAEPPLVTEFPKNDAKEKEDKPLGDDLSKDKLNIASDNEYEGVPEINNECNVGNVSTVPKKVGVDDHDGDAYKRPDQNLARADTNNGLPNEHQPVSENDSCIVCVVPEGSSQIDTSGVARPPVLSLGAILSPSRSLIGTKVLEEFNQADIPESGSLVENLYFEHSSRMEAKVDSEADDIQSEVHGYAELPEEVVQPILSSAPDQPHLGLVAPDIQDRQRSS